MGLAWPEWKEKADGAGGVGTVRFLTPIKITLNKLYSFAAVLSTVHPGVLDQKHPLYIGVFRIILTLNLFKYIFIPSFLFINFIFLLTACTGLRREDKEGD